MIGIEYYKKSKEYLDYNPNTGVLSWRISPKKSIQIGTRAGSMHHSGYRSTGFTIKGKFKCMREHRIIWYIIHGELPEFLDYINGNREDNRICNLRICTKSDNNQNVKKRVDNKSGYKGTSWHKNAQKWVAQIQVNCRKIHIGLYDTPEEAHKAYCMAADKYHGEFKNYGTS